MGPAMALPPFLRAVQFNASYFISLGLCLAVLLGQFKVVCVRYYAQCLAYDRNLKLIMVEIQ